MQILLRGLAVLSLLIFAGCATKSRSDALTTTLKAYASALRWGDFESAQVFLDPDYRAAHSLSKLDIARYAQVHVSGYDEGSGATPDGTGTVTQTVHISLINVNTQSERTVVDHQTWHYDEPSKHWWLTSGLPDLSQN